MSEARTLRLSLSWWGVPAGTAALSGGSWWEVLTGTAALSRGSGDAKIHCKHVSVFN